jgi:hypothetical protein
MTQAPTGVEAVGGGKEDAVMATYRRKKTSDTWHWCRNCSNWPTSDYVEQSTKPTTGELDNECRAKADAGSCSS